MLALNLGLKVRSLFALRVQTSAQGPKQTKVFGQSPVPNRSSNPQKPKPASFTLHYYSTLHETKGKGASGRRRSKESLGGEKRKASAMNEGKWLRQPNWAWKRVNTKDWIKKIKYKKDSGIRISKGKEASKGKVPSICGSIKKMIPNLIVYMHLNL